VTSSSQQPFGGVGFYPSSGAYDNNDPINERMRGSEAQCWVGKSWRKGRGLYIVAQRVCINGLIKFRFCQSNKLLRQKGWFSDESGVDFCFN